MDVCMCTQAGTQEGHRGISTQEPESQVSVNCLSRCWEQNSGPLLELNPLFSSAPPLQLHLALCHICPGSPTTLGQRRHTTLDDLPSL